MYGMKMIELSGNRVAVFPNRTPELMDWVSAVTGMHEDGDSGGGSMRCASVSTPADVT